MSDALLDCQIKNKALASILNQKEQEAFDKVVQAQDWTWIGLQYNKTIGKWKWASEVSFGEWADSMIIAGERCSMINSNKKWETENCSRQNVSHFLCFGGLLKI